MYPLVILLSSQVTFIFVRGVETTNQLWYIMVPPGNLLQFANLKMAHKNSWFAVLKGGDFPVRKPFVYQTVNTITPVTCSTSECSSGYGHDHGVITSICWDKPTIIIHHHPSSI